MLTHCLLEQDVVYSTFVFMLTSFVLEQGVMYFAFVRLEFCVCNCRKGIQL